MTQFPDQMVARLAPPASVSHEATGLMTIPMSGRPDFRIEIPSMDGQAMLLVLREEGGRLIVEGDESRWDEAAKRFLYQMMEWSGLVGIRWKNEVIKTTGSGV
jgi:hypothetical protein